MVARRSSPPNTGISCRGRGSLDIADPVSFIPLFYGPTFMCAPRKAAASCSVSSATRCRHMPFSSSSEHVDTSSATQVVASKLDVTSRLSRARCLTSKATQSARVPSPA